MYIECNEAGAQHKGIYGVVWIAHMKAQWEYAGGRRGRFKLENYLYESLSL